MTENNHKRCRVTNPHGVICGDERERWYYGGTFVDGDKNCIVILNAEIVRLLVRPTAEQLIAKTHFINLGKDSTFPRKIFLGIKDKWCVEIEGFDSEHSVHDTLIVSITQTH